MPGTLQPPAITAQRARSLTFGYPSSLIGLHDEASRRSVSQLVGRVI
jgi:hypothetical protein